MKFWNNEHEFKEPWHTVVGAAMQKYPNPENENVIGMDVLAQQVREDGVLQNERLIKSKFSIPDWARKITGFTGAQYSYEYSEIDPKKKEMRLVTRNLNCTELLRVDEQLVYTPHPEDPERTLMRQEAKFSVNLPALTDYCERCFVNVYQKHAIKGPKGVEWVMEQLASELDDGLRQISGAHGPNAHPQFASWTG